MVNFCSNNSNIQNNANCRSFIQSSTADGLMDTAMSAYCATTAGQADAICSCINSKIPCPNKFDTRCTSNAGYVTNAMISATCPTIIDCTQQVTLTAADLSAIAANNIQQNCTSNTTTGSGTTSQSQTNSTTPVAAASSSSSITDYVIYAIAFIIIVFLIMYAMDDSSTSGSVESVKSGFYSLFR
jgi:cobalamin biosynthesis Mg chelatase CobN